MKRYCPGIWKGLLGMLLAIFNAGCSVFGIRTYEITNYDVILDEADKEVRYYPSHIVARTAVQGEFKEAQEAAFRILAAYIFGDNETKRSIAMTAPVVQEPSPGSEKIAMTAPVIQRPGEDGWVMSFMMPSVYDLEELPTPIDKRVRLETIPARYVAAIRYTWSADESRNARKARELERWVAGLKGYEPVSPPMFAGYDPPWTLPFFRRNEMMIEVKKDREQP